MPHKPNLYQYSSLALACIGTGVESDAQAVYVDIDPDTILSLAPVEYYALEFNDMGANDFRFGKGIGTNYQEWCECSVFSSLLTFGGTASKVVHSDYLFTTTSYFVSALNEGVFINEDLQFNDGDTKMAFRFIPDWSIYYLFEGGDWYPEAIDKYVGIRFEDSLKCMHYGWIRCSVEDNGSKLTIKDYAYESKCDTGIKAGDVIGDTTVAIEEINVLDASVYSFNHTIYILLPSEVNNALVSIHDVLGKQVYFNEIISQSAQIELPEAKGMFLIKIRDGNNQFAKELYLN